MRGVNTVIICGTLGKDPETRYTSGGKPITSFSIATSESWKDEATGEKKERTEWHNITAFGKLAEICGEYLKKGAQVYVEGQIKTDKYNDKDGVEKRITKIVINAMQMLGGGERSEPRGSRTAPGAGARQERQSQPAPRSAPNDRDDFDDDIPF